MSAAAHVMIVIIVINYAIGQFGRQFHATTPNAKNNNTDNNSSILCTALFHSVPR